MTVSERAAGALACAVNPIAIHWPAPGQVRAAFGGRSGGVSAPPYDSMNLGAHVGDNLASVTENRRRWRASLHGAPRVVYLNQVHGTLAVEITRLSADGARADASYTTGTGVACTVMVADCLPILLCSMEGGTVIAAIHAGWRGLASGVIESSLASIRRVAGPRAALIAWLGPCIGPDAFEVGDDVRTACLGSKWSREALAGPMFRPSTAPGKWWCDLAGLARLRLRAAGVEAAFGNDSTRPWCTWHQSATFFSHRRDAARLGGSGRMAASVWIDG